MDAADESITLVIKSNFGSFWNAFYDGEEGDANRATRSRPKAGQWKMSWRQIFEDFFKAQKGQNPPAFCASWWAFGLSNEVSVGEIEEWRTLLNSAGTLEAAKLDPSRTLEVGNLLLPGPSNTWNGLTLQLPGIGEHNLRPEISEDDLYGLSLPIWAVLSFSNSSSRNYIFR